MAAPQFQLRVFVLDLSEPEKKWCQRWYRHHWLVVSTPLKNISQLGWLFPKYKMFQTTNQIMSNRVNRMPHMKHIISWYKNYINIRSYLPWSSCSYDATDRQPQLLREHPVFAPLSEIATAKHQTQMLHVQNTYLPTFAQKTILM